MKSCYSLLLYVLLKLSFSFPALGVQAASPRAAEPIPAFFIKSLLFMVFCKSVNCYCTDRAARAEEFAGTTADAYFFRDSRNPAAVVFIGHYADRAGRAVGAAACTGILARRQDTEVKVDSSSTDVCRDFLLARYRLDGA